MTKKCVTLRNSIMLSFSVLGIFWYPDWESPHQSYWWECWLWWAYSESRQHQTAARTHPPLFANVSLWVSQLSLVLNSTLTVWSLELVPPILRSRFGIWRSEQMWPTSPATLDLWPPSPSLRTGTIWLQVRQNRNLPLHSTYVHFDEYTIKMNG